MSVSYADVLEAIQAVVLSPYGAALEPVGVLGRFQVRGIAEVHAPLQKGAFVGH